VGKTPALRRDLTANDVLDKATAAVNLARYLFTVVPVGRQTFFMRPLKENYLEPTNSQLYQL
jgi:hypothetical protein